jgi:cytochrome c2
VLKTRTYAAALCVLAAGAAWLGSGLFGAAKPGDAAKGKQLFSQNCDVCHNADSADAKVGPGLKGLFKKASLQNKKKVTDASVMDIINKGSPSGMPDFMASLSEQDRADVLAFLKTL